MGNKRIKWVDSAKGIGIILVVWGHTFLPLWLDTIIYSFHMPLFFFLSGYVFKGVNEKFMEFIDRKSQRLLLPFSFFAILSYAYWFLTSKVIGYTNQDNAWLVFLSIILPFKDYGVVGALWFLTSLFVVSILYYLLQKHVRGGGYKIILLMISSLVGYLYGHYIPYRLIGFSDVAFTGIIFFAAGAYYKRFECRMIIMEKYYLVLLPFLVIVNLYFALLNGKVSLAGLKYGFFIYFYLSSSAGILVCTVLGKKIENINFIRYFGRNSIIILGLHIIIFNFVDFVRQYLFHISYMDLKGSFWAGVIHTSIILLTLIPVIQIINSYFPFMIGKKEFAR